MHGSDRHVYPRAQRPESRRGGTEKQSFAFSAGEETRRSRRAAIIHHGQLSEECLSGIDFCPIEFVSNDIRGGCDPRTCLVLHASSLFTGRLSLEQVEALRVLPCAPVGWITACHAKFAAARDRYPRRRCRVPLGHRAGFEVTHPAGIGL